LSASVSDPGRVGGALSDLCRAEVPVVGFALCQPSLDEVFLALTGRPAEEPDAEVDEEEDAA
jgi:daunorubicin/doxorubicin transport system ATP-binding protein